MFVTGALTLFYAPLTAWEEPLAQEHVAFDSYQALLEAASPPVGEFQLYLPSQGVGRPSIAYVPPGAGSWQGYWVGDGGSPPVARREQLAGLLYDLHFFWHFATGLALQYSGGLALVVFLLAIASRALLSLGRRRVRQAFSERAAAALGGSHALRGRSWARVISLTVQAAYAYTGALMVLSPLLVQGSFGPVFDGDIPRALRAADYFGEELAEEQLEAPGPPAPALSLDELAAAALRVRPDLRVESFSAVNYGSDNGIIDVRGSVASGPPFAASLKRNTSVRLRTVDGVVLQVHDRVAEGATAFVARWLQGLHHALYAGMAIRAIIFALSVGGSCAWLLQSHRWLSGQGRGDGARAVLCRAIARCTAGVGTGTFVAVAVLFSASRVLPLSWASRGDIEALLFSAALVICVVWAATATSTVRCCLRQLTLAGLLLLPVPALAARWSSAGLFGNGTFRADVVSVDVGLLLLSFALLGAGYLVSHFPHARRHEPAIPDGMATTRNSPASRQA